MFRIFFSGRRSTINKLVEPSSRTLGVLGCRFIARPLGVFFLVCWLCTFFHASDQLIAQDDANGSVKAKQAVKRNSATKKSRDQKPQPPKMREYDRQAKVFAKNARHEEVAVRHAAIYNLCHLHQIVVLDPRFATHDKMKSIRFYIGTQLQKWERDHRQDLARNEKMRKKLANKMRIQNKQRENTAGKQEVIEEYAGDDGSDTRIENAHPVVGSMEQELDLIVFQSMTQSYSAMGELSGGPGQLYQYAGGRFAAPWDHAGDLIELIQATISPSVWQSAGGASTIHYYQPSQAMVVRASQKVQDDICELLFKLRAAF